MISKLFLGNPEANSKYYPKIVEHLYYFFANIILSVYLIFLFIKILPYLGNNQELVFDTLNELWFKIISAFGLFAYLSIWFLLYRLIKIVQKTIKFKSIVYCYIALSILFLTSPFALILTFISFKKNEVFYA